MVALTLSTGLIYFQTMEESSIFLPISRNVVIGVGPWSSLRTKLCSLVMAVRNFPSAAVSAATFGERPRQAADAAHLLLLAGSQRRCSLDPAGALKVCLRSVEIFDWKD